MLSRRTDWIFCSILAMLVALWVSRAALSITVMVFLALTLVHGKVPLQWRAFRTSPLLVSLTVLFLVPFVSGLWSTNTEAWLVVVRVKLPLLLLPLAFAGPWQLSPARWHWVAVAFLALLFLSTLPSLGHYAQNWQQVHDSYRRAGVLVTPLENDHVRYSWLLAVGTLLCLLLVHTAEKRKEAPVFIFLGIWFAACLHLLAARTGLLSFYGIMGAYTVWLLLRRRNKYAFAALGALLLLPLLAWLTLPTLQNRVSYLLYDLRNIATGTYQPGATDGNRLHSFKAGWALLRNHPFGVGAGDLESSTREWYASAMPGLHAADKIAPSSEWLVYGAAAGWLGIALFTLAMLVPLVTPTKHRFFWVLLHAAAAFSFLFDVGLEVQYGVFLYTFITLWWYKWFRAEYSLIKQPPTNQTPD